MMHFKILSDIWSCNKSEVSRQKLPPFKICWPTWTLLSWSQTTKNAEKLRVANLTGWHHSGAVWISIPIKESKFSSFGQVFTQIYPRDQWHFATIKSRENADLKNYRKLSPLQLSLSHPENKYILSKLSWFIETLCIYLYLCTPCICQPRVNIATKKAGELFEKE